MTAYVMRISDGSSDVCSSDLQGGIMSSIGLALLNSLDIGLLLFVIAIGLNIIFGVLNVINFAHGALYMLGAYLAYSFIILWGMPFWLTLLVAQPDRMRVVQGRRVSVRVDLGGRRSINKKKE